MDLAHTPSVLKRLCHALTAAVLTAALLTASPVSAAVLDADYVGGVQVVKAAALRNDAPDVYFPSGMLSTIDGRQLWARDPDSKRAMASTTKIMTAVVVLENADLDAIVEVKKRTVRNGQSVMGLIPGERYTVRDLLKGVLVQSGNDAAELLAQHIGGSVDGFVAMMNDKAAALDLRNTHFTNPHGMDEKGHHTSASDLTSLARYAMRNPEFRSMVGKRKDTVRSNLYTHSLTSHNILLKTYKGAQGIKTGWTDDAGYCIVVSAKRGNVELVGAVLGAPSEGGRAQQAKKLLDWGFKHYRSTLLATAGDSFGRVPITDYMERTVGAVTAQETSAAVFDLAGEVKQRVALKKGVRAPVEAGENVGTLTVYQGKTVLTQIPLVADRDIPAPTLWQRIVFFFGKLWRGIFGG